MGDVYVELENYADRVLAEGGHLDKSEVRSRKVKVLADTGSTMLVLPEDLVDNLGLKRRGKVIVTYADEGKLVPRLESPYFPHRRQLKRLAELGAWGLGKE